MSNSPTTSARSTVPSTSEIIHKLQPQHVRNSLRLNYKNLSKMIDTKSLAVDLFSNYVINNKEKEKLDRKVQYDGPTAQSELLIDCMMCKTDKELDGFLEVVKADKRHTEAYKLITQTSLDIADGNVPLPAKSFLNRIKTQLIQRYTNQKYNKVEALPGESFCLDLQSQKYIMPLELEVVETTKTYDAFAQNMTQMDSKFASYDSIEDVLEKFKESGESRYVSCRGNPGAGKTLQVHRLVCIWMDSKNDKLKDFHAVFVLPLRDIVYKEDPLLKILGSDMNGLKYIANEDIEMFNMYLSNNKAISTKILFILDGVDEAQFSENSEIYKLLTRQIFPDVSIMVTSRPESSVLNDMYLKPLLDTYVYIRGTSDTGITQYLQDVLSFPSNGPTMEQRTCVIKRCKTEMTDLTLHIPLYLALIGFILRKHWEAHHSFDQLDLPDRATQLVNTFVRVQLRIWLQRLQRYRDAKQLDFNRSPLEEGCTVPIDILSKLVSFGKLSYNLINDNMSSFKRGQLYPLLIDFNDIQHSGFFSVTTDSIKFHHKQIQEYLAAIYISHEKYNEITFKQLFTRLSDRPQTILETFQNIEMVIKFVFGLSPGFAMDILKNFKKCGVVVPYIKPIGIVLNYEASLCWESDDEKITAEMRELFLNCKRKSVEQYAFEESVLKTKLTMDHLFTGVSKKYVNSIIEQWYNSFITENDTETSYHLEMKELDTFLMYLLHHYDSTFNNVRSLNIHESSMTDINVICNFFPKLEYVKANVIAVTDDNTFFTMDCSQPKYHTLKHLTLQSGTGSLNFCLSLLDQTELHSLRLSNVNSQSIIPLETANLNWKKLKTLELHLFEIDPNYALNVVKAVDNVLRSIPSLVSLSLGCARNKMSPTGYNMSYLLKAVGDFIEAHSEHLSTLGMFNIMDIDSLSTLLQKLPELPHLEVVGFGELSEHSSIDFNQVFIKCQKLKNIQVATKKDEITIRSQFTSTFKKYKRSLNLYVYDCDILQQRFVCDLNMPKNAEKFWLARRIRQRHQPIPVKSNWFFDQLELWSKC